MSNDSESSTASSADLLKPVEKCSNGGKSRGPGRPKKVTTTACTWCAEAKLPLKFIINQAGTQKEFCSENCVAEFRNAYRKGACLVCDNVIRENAPHRDFCSSFCLNSDQHMKDAKAAATTNGDAAATASSSPSTAAAKGAANFNNNSIAENLNMSPEVRLQSYRSGGPGSGSSIFQYEQLNVFDWNVYLKVRVYVTWARSRFLLTLYVPPLFPCSARTACLRRPSASSRRRRRH